MSMMLPRLFLFVCVFLVSCSPVFGPEIMRHALLDPPFESIKESSVQHEGKLFLLGGTIVETKLVEQGSLIEAAYVPVDSRGYHISKTGPDRRFLALLPKDKGLLDPLIYKSGREITIAGIFIENRKGTIQQMPYLFPVFEVRGIYLWPVRTEYYIRSYPYWYDPWYDPWDYPFGYRPWWRYHPHRYWR